jgi:hypothetical protein
MSIPDSPVISGIERLGEALHSEDIEPSPRSRGIADCIQAFIFYASELTDADSNVVIRADVSFCCRAEQTQPDTDLIFTNTRNLCTAGLLIG